MDDDSKELTLEDLDEVEQRFVALYDPEDTTVAAWKRTEQMEQARVAATEKMMEIANARREPKKMAFLLEFSQRGIIGLACKVAGISRGGLAIWRRDDPQFELAYHEAEQMAVDALEHEAHRRGVEGVPEPVYYLGKEVGTVLKYSDGLLKFLMGARDPKRFRERVDVHQTGKVGDAGEPVKFYLPSNGREVVVKGKKVEE